MMHISTIPPTGRFGAQYSHCYSQTSPPKCQGVLCDQDLSERTQLEECSESPNNWQLIMCFLLKHKLGLDFPMQVRLVSARCWRKKGSWENAWHMVVKKKKKKKNKMKREGRISRQISKSNWTWECKHYSIYIFDQIKSTFENINEPYNWLKFLIKLTFIIPKLMQFKMCLSY